MDVIVNDVFLEYVVEGFFIIFFVLVNDKRNFIKYGDGEWEFSDLVKFVVEKVIVFLIKVKEEF